MFLNLKFVASLTITILFFVSGGDFAALAPRVKFDIYYEYLCPGCSMFTKSQLAPAIKSIGEILDITLIPYGGAETKKHANGSYTFECQHGPIECLGNKLHACAIKKLSIGNDLASFLNCSIA